MKKKLFYTAVAITLFSNFCFAQNKIEKYCEVSVTKTLFGKKVSVDFGGPDIYFKDSTVKKNLLTVANFKNAVDVLDYMNKLGWDLVSSLSIKYSTWEKVFYFRKIFDTSEITTEGNSN